MMSTLIAVAGSLLGVAVGFLAQRLQDGLAHRRRLDDLRREACAELLRAVSASYAQASAGGGTFEDAAVLKATTVIELLSAPEIDSAAHSLANQVAAAHGRLRRSGCEAARPQVDAADHARLGLIRLFKADLGIRQAQTPAVNMSAPPSAPTKQRRPIRPASRHLPRCQIRHPNTRRHTRVDNTNSPIPCERLAPTLEPISPAPRSVR
jgi:hypothetical protein